MARKLGVQTTAQRRPQDTQRTSPGILAALSSSTTIVALASSFPIAVIGASSRSPLLSALQVTRRPAFLSRSRSFEQLSTSPMLRSTSLPSTFKRSGSVGLPQPPNNSLQRTRLRAPLSSKPLGAQSFISAIAAGLLAASSLACQKSRTPCVYE